MLPRPSKDSDSGLVNGDLAGGNSGRGVSSPPCVSVSGGAELFSETENLSASKGNVSRNTDSYFKLFNCEYHFIIFQITYAQMAQKRKEEQEAAAAAAFAVKAATNHSANSTSPVSTSAAAASTSGGGCSHVSNSATEDHNNKKKHIVKENHQPAVKNTHHHHGEKETPLSFAFPYPTRFFEQVNRIWAHLRRQ